MNNKSTVVIDGVVYSADKKVLIKYPNDKNETVFRIPDFVEEIAEECFMDVKPPKKVYMGNNVKKICNNAIGDQCTFCIRQIYIPPTVVELEGEIFDQGVADSGEYYPVDVVGGQKDSTIEFYCNERGIPFVYVAPDEVEKFYSMSTKELIDLAKSQAESINEFVIDEGEKGYQMTFANGTLTVCATSNAPANVVVEKTRVRINEFLRPKVQKLVISNGITGIADLAFDSYDNLEQIYIGADVSVISPMAFTGRESGTSWGCPKLSAITVDEQNKWYKSVDGVLFTHDMQTLVKYCPATPGLYYEVDSQVRYIGKLAFARAKICSV